MNTKCLEIHFHTPVILSFLDCRRPQNMKSSFSQEIERAGRMLQISFVLILDHKVSSTLHRFPWKFYNFKEGYNVLFICF